MGILYYLLYIKKHKISCIMMERRISGTCFISSHVLSTTHKILVKFDRLHCYSLVLLFSVYNSLSYCASDQTKYLRSRWWTGKNTFKFTFTLMCSSLFPSLFLSIPFTTAPLYEVPRTKYIFWAPIRHYSLYNILNAKNGFLVYDTILVYNH